MHPDVYKRPLLWALILLIILLAVFYKPVPGVWDVCHWLPQKDVTLVGRVENFYVKKPTSNNVIVKVFSVNGEKADGYVYARLPEFEPEWKDTLEISGRLQAPYGIDLLGNFNWKKFLAHKHVFTEIKSSDVRVIKLAAWPWRALRTVRTDILRVFAQNLPPDLAHIAGGILLGERGDLDPALYTAFQDSGAIHLLVASGGNVGFVTLMTLAVCGLFNIRRKKALLLALAVAGVYTLIAGADAPLMRAYFMAVCACGGYYLGRNSGVLQGLLVSCLVILIFTPASLLETGFVMSFLATAALIICLNNYPVPQKWPRLVRFFAQIFLATLSVQLVLLPVFTNVFYKVSLTGLAANMLLVPLASLLLGISFFYYVFSWVGLGKMLFYPLYGGLVLFKWIVEYFASFTLSAVPVTAWKADSVAAYYVGLFWVLNWPVKKWAKKGWGPVLGVIVLLLGIQYASSRGTYVYILDEWYKNAVILKTSDGNLFVVGPQLPPEKLKAALYKLGSKQATAVFLTEDKPIKFDYSVLAPQVVQPFENKSPVRTDWTFGQTSVKLIEGLHETRAGLIWQKDGFKGKNYMEGSYCFTVKEGPEFCVGVAGKFVRTPQRTLDPVLNQTVREKL